MFLHNPIADMPGPLFLIFYACIAIGLALACRWMIRSYSGAAGGSLPQISVAPDPYELAYLRGGASEVVNAAVWMMIHKGYLILTESPGQPSVRELRRSDLQSAQGALKDLERSILRYFNHPRAESEIFGSKLTAHIEVFTNGYQRRLVEQRLVYSAEVKRLAFVVWCVAAVTVTVIALYKLNVAHIKGYAKTSGLKLELLFAHGLLAGMCFILPHRTPLGDAYLKRLRLVSESLRRQVTQGRWQEVQSSFPLLVGVYGAGTLSCVLGSAYVPLFKLRTVSSGSSDSSCGSGGCGGGDGGCGGCGD